MDTSVRGHIGLVPFEQGVNDNGHSVLSWINPGIHSEACVQPCVNGVVHNESLFNQTNGALFIVSLCASHTSVEVSIISLRFSHAQMAKLIISFYFSRASVTLLVMILGFSYVLKAGLMIQSCEKGRADNESVQSCIDCDVHNECVQSCINFSFQSCMCGDAHDQSLFNSCINCCF